MRVDNCLGPTVLSSSGWQAGVSPGVSPVGCKQKVRKPQAWGSRNSPLEQGGLNMDPGGTSEGLLPGKTDALKMQVFNLGSTRMGTKALSQRVPANIPDTLAYPEHW